MDHGFRIVGGSSGVCGSPILFCDAVQPVKNAAENHSVPYDLLRWTITLSRAGVKVCGETARVFCSIDDYSYIRFKSDRQKIIQFLGNDSGARLLQ